MSPRCPTTGTKLVHDLHWHIPGFWSLGSSRPSSIVAKSPSRESRREPIVDEAEDSIWGNVIQSSACSSRVFGVLGGHGCRHAMSANVRDAHKARSDPVGRQCRSRSPATSVGGWLRYARVRPGTSIPFGSKCSLEYEVPGSVAGRSRQEKNSSS